MIYMKNLKQSKHRERALQENDAILTYKNLKVKHKKTDKISQKRIHQPDAQTLSDFETNIY